LCGIEKVPLISNRAPLLFSSAPPSRNEIPYPNPISKSILSFLGAFPKEHRSFPLLLFPSRPMGDPLPVPFTIDLTPGYCVSLLFSGTTMRLAMCMETDESCSPFPPSRQLLFSAPVRSFNRDGSPAFFRRSSLHNPFPMNSPTKTPLFSLDRPCLLKDECSYCWK